jgi:hypothetical protein
MAEMPSEYNAKVIAEFRANQGRVGAGCQDGGIKVDLRTLVR